LLGHVEVREIAQANPSAFAKKNGCSEKPPDSLPSVFKGIDIIRLNRCFAKSEGKTDYGKDNMIGILRI
jgi:hypothetical protein